MHRCYVNPAEWNESEMLLTADEEHHLLDVLRAKAGNIVAVFDGMGREAKAVVAEGRSKRSEVRGRISEIRNQRSEIEDRNAEKRIGLRGRVLLRVVNAGKEASPGLSLILIQSLPKGKKMDLIVEKAVELGVTEIMPVISERTIVRLDADARKERGERWQRLALSASRQCGTSWVPDVRPVRDYSEALRECSGFDLLLVGSLGSDARSLHDVLNEAGGKGAHSGASLGQINAAREDTRPPRISRAMDGEEWEGETPVEPRQKNKLAPAAFKVGLIIGPEGDLTPAEIKQAVDAGAAPVSFGQLVLRVDTAALYGLSVLAYEFLGKAAGRRAISSALNPAGSAGSLRGH